MNHSTCLPTHPLRFDLFIGFILLFCIPDPELGNTDRPFAPQIEDPPLKAQWLEGG
jgi:hypothetical protein